MRGGTSAVRERSDGRGARHGLSSSRVRKFEFSFVWSACSRDNLLLSEEDNDEVVAILDSDTKRLCDFYGDFYVSEMLRHPDHTRRLVVGEKRPGKIDSVVCLNRSLNLRLLNEIFDLDAFGKLGKRQPKNDPRLRAAASKSMAAWNIDDFEDGRG